MMKLIKKVSLMKKNIVGGEILGESKSVDKNSDIVHKTNTEFWDTIGSGILGTTALPSWNSFLPPENKLNLLGDLTGKSVLEIGCGNGHSLEYAAKHGATDLWGLDISANQIAKANEYLRFKGLSPHLICSPMEKECCLPTNYFDVVYSVYGIGWSTDLNITFKLINSYLKDRGVFVFSWSHPIHKCVSIENGQLIFSNSYFNEKWYCTEMGNKEIILSNRMLSTYINELVRNGFVIEQLIEETDNNKAIAANSDFGRKALMLPTAFVIRSQKRKD